MTHLPPLPAGYRLLCLAAAPGGGDHDAQVAAAIAAIDDWQAVFRAARHHHLVPPLATLLHTAAGAQAPAAIRARLRQLQIQQTQRCLRQTQTLARLCERLAAADIRVLSVKGTPLSQLLFHDLARRGIGDIDLLVAPDRVAAALDVLIELGWRNEDPDIPAAAMATVPFRDLGLRHPSAGLVELHRRLTDDPTLFAFDFETLWRNRRKIDDLPAAITTLADDHCALYLVLHGSEHGWTRLRWLADLVPILIDARSRQALDALAAPLGLSPAVANATALCEVLLLGRDPARLPPAQRRYVARHRSWFVAGDAWTRQSNGAGLSPARAFLFHMRIRWMRYTMRPTWRGLWASLRTELNSPVDWPVLRLPPALHWLYPTLRPLGWAIRRLRRISRHRGKV